MPSARLFSDDYYEGSPVTVRFNEIDTITALMHGVAAIGIPER